MDDTQAIQNKLDAESFGGTVVLDWKDTFEFTTLRLWQGQTLRGKNRERTVLRKIGNAKNGIDAVGVPRFVLKDFRMENAEDAQTECLLLMGQMTGSYVVDKVLLDNVRIDGRCSIASVYGLSVCSALAHFCEFYSYNTQPAFIMTGGNYFNASSDNAEMSDAGHTWSDWSFNQCEFHNVNGFPSSPGPGGFACWIGGAESCRWFGGNMSANAGHKVMTVNAVAGSAGQKNPNRLLFLGTTFYADSGQIPPSNVLGIPPGIDLNAGVASCTFIAC